MDDRAVKGNQKTWRISMKNMIVGAVMMVAGICFGSDREMPLGGIEQSVFIAGRRKPVKNHYSKLYTAPTIVAHQSIVRHVLAVQVALGNNDKAILEAKKHVRQNPPRQREKPKQIKFPKLKKYSL
jgi:hypothetical protein